MFLWAYCWVRIIALESVSREKQITFSNVGGPHLIGWKFAESSDFVFNKVRWNSPLLALPWNWFTGFSHLLTQMDTSAFRLELYPWPSWVSCLSTCPEGLGTYQILQMHESIHCKKPCLSSPICHLSANHLFITCYLSINHHHHQPIYFTLILLLCGTLTNGNVNLHHHGVISRIVQSGKRCI